MILITDKPDVLSRANHVVILGMSSRLDKLDLDVLPADVRAVLLAVEAERIETQKRADQLQTYNERLEHTVGGAVIKNADRIQKSAFRQDVREAQSGSTQS